MTHLSPIQFETRRRQLGAELERESARVASRRVSPRPRRARPRWLRAVRGAAAT
jgi:hypothetical protein